MPELNQQPFLDELMQVIDRNLPNELFGVSELAEEMNMSRSNLLRKVKKETALSVSQLISQARLKKAMDLLKTSQLNVTEVSQQVGFNSTSYFIKCFREHYGFPPGEVNKKGEAEPKPLEEAEDQAAGWDAQMPLSDGSPIGQPYDKRSGPAKNAIRSFDESNGSGRQKWAWIGGAVLVIALGLGVGWYFLNRSEGPKSIAVLPFKNESADSSNLYLINGLMDATLNNLQGIGNLNVVSRTTAEKYRSTSKSIPEMASELNVQYFIEGSGQKIGNRILLNVQLIDAKTDSHLWARQYRRESADIFALQQEIANDIVREIKVIVTPEELGRIEKRPTQNIEAYEAFLQGKEHFYQSKKADLEAAIPWFRKAIEHDPQFALAYAHLVMVYYYLDIFNVVKNHTADVDDMSDKAILYDPKLSEALVAKALSFAQRHRYDLATPYLERALEYSPRSGLVMHFLAEFYNLYDPNPHKYLEIAIRKAKVDAANDSTTRAFNYFHVSNALFQNGFTKEADQFIQRSIALDPNGFFSRYLRAWVPNFANHNWKAVKETLEQEYNKTPMRFDILAEIAKAEFIMRDYASASKHYDSALSMMNMFRMDILKYEYLRIGIAHEHTGDTAKANYFYKEYQAYVDQDQTFYHDLNQASLLIQKGKKKEALDLITRFADTQEMFHYQLLLIDVDPTCEDLFEEKQFKAAVKKINENFTRSHKALDDKWRDEFEKL
ncbi:helix-turn-helix domain-containing protein [Chryseolinea sp. T2]|uniref:helix-turn-helix domain-containing protein n=1 Tax=Chryseolinea sp. T2 TaxID=3129255 RepID=UPI003078A622